MELVGADGEQVDAELGRVQRDLAGCLNGIRVENHAPLSGNLADPVDRLQSARLVVGNHDGDQPSVRTHGSGDLLGIHHAFPSHGQVGDLDTPLFKILAGVDHGMVLDLRGHQVPGGFRGPFHDSADGQVVAFGAAGGEHDFVGLRVQQVSHLFPRQIQGLLGLLPISVNAGGVAEELPVAGQHGFQHLRGYPGGCVVVQIDTPHGLPLNRQPTPSVATVADSPVFSRWIVYTGKVSGAQ